MKKTLLISLLLFALAVAWWLVVLRPKLAEALRATPSPQAAVASQTATPPGKPEWRPPASSGSPPAPSSTNPHALPAWATAGTPENQALIAAYPQLSNRVFKTYAEMQAETEASMEKTRRVNAEYGLDPDVEVKERELKALAAGLRVGMSTAEVIGLMGPAFSTSGPVQIPIGISGDVTSWRGAGLERGNTVMTYTPHPKRSWHKIGDSFQVLTVYFDTNDLSRVWGWFYPDRN